MKLTQLSEDVLLLTSAVWQTNCTAIRAGDRTVLVDSVVLPEEIEQVPRVLDDAGFDSRKVTLLTTHADWDHLLGRLSFPAAELVCGEPTALRLSAEQNEPAANMAEFDEAFYITRPEQLNLAPLTPLPVPGEYELGTESFRSLPAPGHTEDGVAYLLRDAGVLLAGDYLSHVEIPRIRDSYESYLETLSSFEPVISEQTIVISGHGPAKVGLQAKRALEEDRAYLDRLVRDGSAAALPAGRDNVEQRRVHTQMNVQRLAGGSTEGVDQAVLTASRYHEGNQPEREPAAGE